MNADCFNFVATVSFASVLASMVFPDCQFTRTDVETLQQSLIETCEFCLFGQKEEYFQLQSNDESMRCVNDNVQVASAVCFLKSKE